MAVTITPYDFEALKARFCEMSHTEILDEYVYLTHTRQVLMDSTDYETFIEHIGAIDDARNYLGHYIALWYCSEQGLEVEI